MAHFRLQSVLDYRQSLEDQAQQHLAEALMVESRLRRQLDEAEAERTRVDGQRRQREEEGLSIAELQLYQSRIDHQRRLSQELQGQLQHALAVTAERQQQLLLASQDREAMEKLKERDRQRQQARQKQQETKDLDEVGSRGRHDL